jgi:hypothetical protein
MKSFSESLVDLGVSLNHKHPSMSVKYNPVVSGVENGKLSATELGSVLAQYSLLPATIVGFLSTGRRRLEEWTEVKEELDKNIGEENGSRTSELSHYTILKRALLSELGLDVSEVQASASTTHFLTLVRAGLSEQRPKPFIAGVLYGLEASAVPELRVVAELINDYAGLNSRERMPIRQESIKEAPLSMVADSTIKDNYSLDVFFGLHLWDFEVGHRDGLETSLAKHLKETDEVKDFEAGFEYVLAAMDQWWESLANGSAALNAAPGGSLEEEHRYELVGQ